MDGYSRFADAEAAAAAAAPTRAGGFLPNIWHESHNIRCVTCSSRRVMIIALTTKEEEDEAEELKWVGDGEKWITENGPEKWHGFAHRHNYYNRI